MEQYYFCVGYKSTGGQHLVALCGNNAAPTASDICHMLENNGHCDVVHVVSFSLVSLEQYSALSQPEQQQQCKERVDKHYSGKGSLFCIFLAFFGLLVAVVHACRLIAVSLT